MKRFNTYFCRGELAERSNAAVLKTVDCHRSGGSNPSLSATNHKTNDLKACKQMFAGFYFKTGFLFSTSCSFLVSGAMHTLWRIRIVL